MIVYTNDNYLIQGLQALLRTSPYSGLKIPAAIVDLGCKNFAVLRGVGAPSVNSTPLQIFLDMCVGIIGARELFQLLIQESFLSELTTTYSLTLKQKSILERLLADLTPQEVADDLGVSVKTVYTVKLRAVRKLSTRSFPLLACNLKAFEKSLLSGAFDLQGYTLSFSLPGDVSTGNSYAPVDTSRGGSLLVKPHKLRFCQGTERSSTNPARVSLRSE